MEGLRGNCLDQAHAVFENLSAIIKEGGGSLEDVVKLTVFLTDLNRFDLVSEVLAAYFSPPYPARSVVGIASLPKGLLIEIEASTRLGD